MKDPITLFLVFTCFSSFFGKYGAVFINQTSSYIPLPSSEVNRDPTTVSATDQLPDNAYYITDVSGDDSEETTVPCITLHDMSEPSFKSEIRCHRRSDVEYNMHPQNIGNKCDDKSNHTFLTVEVYRPDVELGRRFIGDGEGDGFPCYPLTDNAIVRSRSAVPGFFYNHICHVLRRILTVYMYVF